MKETQRNNLLYRHMRDAEEGRMDKADLKEKFDQLQDNQQTILRRLINEVTRRDLRYDGCYHFQIDMHNPSINRELRRAGRDDEIAALDPDTGFSETETTYRRLMQRLVDIDALSPENYERPRIYPKSEPDGSMGVYIRFTPRELQRLSLMAGVKPPAMPFAERN